VQEDDAETVSDCQELLISAPDSRELGSDKQKPRLELEQSWAAPEPNFLATSFTCKRSLSNVLFKWLQPREFSPIKAPPASAKGEKGALQVFALPEKPPIEPLMSTTVTARNLLF
jgi:hypothetical protein